MEGQDYSCYGDISQVDEEFGNSDWIEHEGKNYCSDCFNHDDDDKIIINPKMFKEYYPHQFSPPQEEKREITDAIEFAEWIASKRYEMHNTGWRSTIDFTPIETEQLYVLFKQSFIKQKGEEK